MHKSAVVMPLVLAGPLGLGLEYRSRLDCILSWVKWRNKVSFLVFFLGFLVKLMKLGFAGKAWVSLFGLLVKLMKFGFDFSDFSGLSLIFWYVVRTVDTDSFLFLVSEYFSGKRASF